MYQSRSPLIIYANFQSGLAVSLTAQDALDRWAEQASREIWLARPGDVLVTPVPLSQSFQRYAEDLMAIPYGSVAVVTASPVPGAPFAEAVRRSGHLRALRGWCAARPDSRLLPLALDAATVALAARLGVPVAPYGPRGVSWQAQVTAARLNTKSGFRTVAAELDIPVPPGVSCGRAELDTVLAAMLARHERVVVKADRAAGGYGLHYVSRAETFPHGLAGPGGWVVEQRVDVVRSVSVQAEVLPTGPRVLFHGEMRLAEGSWTGYASPLGGLADALTQRLDVWASALGRHLGERGYLGTFGIDAVVDPRGRLFATESNVRRTATTAPHAMAARLGGAAGQGETAWAVGRGSPRVPHAFSRTVNLLRKEGMAWSRERGEGVVLYRQATPGGLTLPYAVLAPDRERLDELEARLREIMRFGTRP
ncbi:peptide ligase PGM1-related protein [Streptomyces sp. MMS24-I2-30]|uniref:preATP grasp domain-containing protein n=1 Tax=Streptomyces sp. MMS24-I2-30 TaxID=3351564 RepID=UPI0038968ED1